MFKFVRVDNIEEDEWNTPRQRSCRLLRRTVSPKVVLPDLMHTKHPGVDWICGSVIWLLVAEVLPGEFDNNRQSLLENMRAFWSGNISVRGITNLTRGLLLGEVNDPQCNTKTCPCLKAKAADAQA